MEKNGLVRSDTPDMTENSLSARHRERQSHLDVDKNEPVRSNNPDLYRNSLRPKYEGTHNTLDNLDGYREGHTRTGNIDKTEYTLSVGDRERQAIISRLLKDFHGSKLINQYATGVESKDRDTNAGDSKLKYIDGDSDHATSELHHRVSHRYHINTEKAKEPPSQIPNEKLIHTDNISKPVDHMLPNC